MKEATLKIDESVKIPAAVRAAAARSEQLFNSQREPAEEPAQEEVTSQGNPELAAASLAQEPAAQSEPTEQKIQAQPAAEPTQPADGESWEHKYKSMHGRYVRGQEIIRQQAETIANLQGVIATMQSAPASTEQPAPAELKAESLLTPDEISDYGEDFLKVVGKKAREEFAPIVKGYQVEIERLKKQLEGVSGAVQQTSQEKLWAKLDEGLPQWRDLNTNEAFLDWLRLPDPYSGAIRHDMLKAAYAQSDARRVLAFFNGFLAEEAAVAPANAEPDQGTTKVPKVPLQNLAAPGRAKTAAATTAPAEKPVFTRAQIAAFYADVAAGKYRGRDADKLKAETMIFEAQREGRIR